MAYTINASKVQLVTVRGMLESQQIINRFHYAYFGVLPSPDVDDSATFLANFRTMWRASILPQAWDDYQVFSYALAEIDGAHLSPTPPHRYITDMNPSKVDELLGVLADKGTIPSVGLVKIPAHEAMRLLWKPATRAPKRFRANYSRLALGFPVSALAAAQEQWTAGIRTAIGAAFSGMATTAIFGAAVPAGTGYFPSAWSVPYFVNVIPLGGNPRDACRSFASASVNNYVGTQITRRFKTTGQFRGV